MGGTNPPGPACHGGGAAGAGPTVGACHCGGAEGAGPTAGACHCGGAAGAGPVGLAGGGGGAGAATSGESPTTAPHALQKAAPSGSAAPQARHTAVIGARQPEQNRASSSLARPQDGQFLATIPGYRFTVKLSALLVPPVVVTVTLTTPFLAVAGTLHLI